MSPQRPTLRDLVLDGQPSHDATVRTWLGTELNDVSKIFKFVMSLRADRGDVARLIATCDNARGAAAGDRFAPSVSNAHSRAGYAFGCRAACNKRGSRAASSNRRASKVGRGAQGKDGPD